jgi:spore coat polysaccharide biosynthesis protein SpsF
MIVAIIQARLGSSRLPGKVLENLAGRSVLDHVIARASRIDGVDRVCIAVPDLARDDALAEAAERAGAQVFRGSENDVLSRYHGAAAATGADVVMRLTSDCPLLDWEVSGAVLKAFLAGGLDYASNLEPRSWPKGLDTEVFSRSALNEAHERATENYDREHVTPYLRAQNHIKRGGVVCSSGDFAGWRWTLDYPEDLQFCQAVLDRADSAFPGFEEIRAIVERSPEIAKINAHLS